MSVSSTKPLADFAQACLLAAPLDFRTLDAPVIHSRTSELGSFDILPLRAATHSTSLKSVVELVEPMSAEDFDFGHLYHLISTAKYEDLPGPLSVSFGNTMKFKMQLVGQQSSDGQWVFLKHFIFEDKIPARLSRHLSQGTSRSSTMARTSAAVSRASSIFWNMLANGALCGSRLR